MDKISFSGGFLITNKPGAKVLSKLYDEAIPKRRCIIPDLFEKDNFFFASKTCYDAPILKYLTNNDFTFRYYPNINLKTRLDSQEPKLAEKILLKEEVIDDIDKINAHIQSLLPPKKPLKYHWKENDHIEQTIQALALNRDNIHIATKNNFTIIKDKSNKLMAKVSPNNVKGESYAIVYPRYSDEEMHFVITNYKGEIVSDTNNIEELKEFKKGFKNAMQVDMGRIRPRKN